MFLGVLGIIQKTMGSLFLSAFDLWSAPPLTEPHHHSLSKVTKNYPAQDICFYIQLFENLFSFLNQMNMVSRQMQCTISKINPKLPSQIFSSYFFFLFFSIKSGKNGQQILFSINQCKGFDSLNYNRIFAFKEIFWFRNSSNQAFTYFSTDF